MKKISLALVLSVSFLLGPLPSFAKKSLFVRGNSQESFAARVGRLAKKSRAQSQKKEIKKVSSTSKKTKKKRGRSRVARAFKKYVKTEKWLARKLIFVSQKAGEVWQYKINEKMINDFEGSCSKAVPSYSAQHYAISFGEALLKEKKEDWTEKFLCYGAGLMSICKMPEMVKSCDRLKKGWQKNPLLEKELELLWMVYHLNCGSKNCPFEDNQDRKKSIGYLIDWISFEREKNEYK